MSWQGWCLASCSTRVGSLQHRGVGALGVQAGLFRGGDVDVGTGGLGWQHLCAVYQQLAGHCTHLVQVN